MTLRSRLAAAPGTTMVPVAKVFGPNVPESFRQGEIAAQMTPASPFSPGTPIGPYEGYDRTPRSHNYVPSVNIAARPRLHERVSFETLSGLIESYDVAQICCVPGTEVITKRGVIPIEDVVVGDEVITHLGRWRRVTETMASLPYTAVRTLKSGGFEDLSVTGNHPVWAVDYWVSQTRSRKARGIGWVSADKLRPRGPVASHSYDGLVLPALDLPDSCPELDVAAAVGDDFVTDDHGMLALGRGGRLTRVPARVRMDAALGRLLGWYMAEGSISQGRHVFFSLGPTEQAYGEQILADAEAVFGLKGGTTPQPSGSGFHVHVSSTVLGKLFACGKAINKRLPAWAWNGGREFFAALLEAWTLGDGCRVERNGCATRIEVATSSRDLAWQMRMVAIGLGISATVVTMRGRDKYNAVINGKRLNSQPVAYHVAWTEKPKRWTRESFEFDGRYLATALVSAEPSDYKGPVYNLEVEEDESYVTTGGTVHNCINHRIDSVRSLDWQLVAADGAQGDVSDAIAVGMKALEKPDRINYFETWLGKWLWDELAYGCGPLYRLRNRAGRCIGLMPVDVRTIAPMLDYWGNPPGAMTPPGEPLPEAYVQFANGVPWNWLTLADLIYEPYRLHNDSPYGRAPIESIILSANTDLRFQLYFLQTFTDGNLPAAFASSPETWTPDQIEQFQAYWDGFMYGDQARKHQIRWLPPGSKFEWSNEKEFTDTFSLFLLRKTAAAFHVVPSDLGLTENVNRSSGESQADVQHRVGDLPFIRYIQRILTGFLQDDLRLPLKFTFDLGEEQDDRAEQANADKIYVDMGAVGVSELREMRYGLTDPEPIPRYIFTERAGPIPIASLLAVAGKIDRATGLPAAGAPLPEEVFGGTEGVLPNPPIKVMSLAEREFGPKAMPPAPPSQPVLQPDQVGQSQAAPVAKEGEGASGPAAGITSETGLYSYDLAGRDDDGDGSYGSAGEEERTLAEDRVRKERASGELAAFKRYSRARRRAGEWRDFRFTAVDQVTAHNLNDDGRLAVRKAAGEVAVAGLAVLAADTGRVLMIQRALDPDDPAGGKIEFPGGHLEADESPLRAAWREWSEETGLAPPPGAVSGEWTAGDGVYRGIVWTTECEASVPVRGESLIPNPDDPDGDLTEAILWLDPCDLPSNPMLRAELATSLPDVLPLLGCPAAEPEDGDESVCPCGTPVVYDETNGWQHADGSVSHDDGESVSDKMTMVAKAADAGPKGLSAPEDWPGWQRDLTLSGIYADQLRDALRDAVDPRQLAEDWARAHPPADQVAKSLPPSVTAFLASVRQAIEAALRKILPSAWAEGWVLGQQSARASATAAAAATPREASAALEAVDWAGWQPGDPEAAYQVAGSGLRDLLASQDVQIKSIASSRLEELGNVLAEHLSSPETGGPVTYSVDSLAAALEDVLDNPSRAEMVAQTEIARAQSAAASWVFRQLGVSLIRISTAADRRVCQRCLSAEAAGPQPIGTYSVPLHPLCRCSAVAASPPLSSLASLAGTVGGGST